MIHVCTKFELSSFSHSGGSPKFSTRVTWRGSRPCGRILHFVA